MPYPNILFPDLISCTICPRKCTVNRYDGNSGYCRSDAGFHVSSICCHKGEEPLIGGKNGICNVFFSHCNLQCIYCQNSQISANDSKPDNEINDFQIIIDSIITLIKQGCQAVGFVSPSHFIPQMKAIIDEIRHKGFHPIIVYNSNAYDDAEELKRLEPYIDIYLPDLKYLDCKLSGKFSDAADYPETAMIAIKEMYRQKGATLRKLDDFQAESGLIIRHLVLPGFIDNSINVLRWIANNLSTRVHISIMSQYYPVPEVKNHPQLGLKISKEEYLKVVNEMNKLGFINGWIQEFDSNSNYLPDFNISNPFE
jgi:putative pyruvate formate lyase activating enzyme